MFALFFDIVHLSAIGSSPRDTSSGVVRQGLRKDLSALSNQIKELEDSQTSSQIRVADASQVQSQLTAIQFEFQAGELKAARSDIHKLQSELAGWRSELAKKAHEKQLQAQYAATIEPAAGSGMGITVPIMIYHYTPDNFESQLQHLIQKGYTTIDLDTLAQAINSKNVILPAKPIVLTFDDGFENQMQAFDLLKKYHMKATYYIITAGDASNYCIGAGRKYDQPKGCGDAYLSWDQIRELDVSGLITIAAHTVDHLNLPAQSPEMQRFQIFEGKQQLETQLGHGVKHFAFPYGSYNAATVALVKEAGFVTAVSTLPGTIHTTATLYSLHRVRDVYHLP